MKFLNLKYLLFILIFSFAYCKKGNKAVSPIITPPIVLVPEELKPTADPLGSNSNPNSTYAGYTLVWNDEFDGATLDLQKWIFETGTGVNGDFGTGQLDRATEREET